MESAHVMAAVFIFILFFYTSGITTTIKSEVQQHDSPYNTNGSVVSYLMFVSTSKNAETVLV